MKKTIRTIRFLGVALLASQFIGATNVDSIRGQESSAAFEQAMPATPAQKEADRLLRQISSNAAVAARHADLIQSFTRNPQFQYETHAGELTSVKNVINAMGSDLRRLQEIRPGALPWQQLALDRIQSLVAGMAGHATEAIERLNQERGELLSQGYRNSVANLYSYASQARKVISVHMDYAQHRDRLNRLDASVSESVTNASAAAQPVQRAAHSLEQLVRSELLKLPYYSVFDHLDYQIEGNQVTLNGLVSSPTLKDDAEWAVRNLAGVETVKSNIQILPLSPNDDRIRLAAYRAIYGHSTLMRYQLNPQPSIRIIVMNGHVTLMGTVGSNMDRAIAHMQANSVPGVFTVTNHLQIGS